jgi:hypothetical protein
LHLCELDIGVQFILILLDLLLILGRHFLLEIIFLGLIFFGLNHHGPRPNFLLHHWNLLLLQQLLSYGLLWCLFLLLSRLLLHNLLTGLFVRLRNFHLFSLLGTHQLHPDLPLLIRLISVLILDFLVLALTTSNLPSVIEILFRRFWNLSAFLA